MQVAGGLIYSGSGGVLDPNTNTILGTYYFNNGSSEAALTIDAVNNRTFAAYTAQGPTLQSFDRTAFTPIWLARLPVESQPLRWGSNGLAWIGPSQTGGLSALYLINGTFVAP